MYLTVCYCSYHPHCATPIIPHGTHTYTPMMPHPLPHPLCYTHHVTWHSTVVILLPYHTHPATLALPHPPCHTNIANVVVLCWLANCVAQTPEWRQTDFMVVNIVIGCVHRPQYFALIVYPYSSTLRWIANMTTPTSDENDCLATLFDTRWPSHQLLNSIMVAVVLWKYASSPDSLDYRVITPLCTPSL